jgi:hypothetical protein
MRQCTIVGLERLEARVQHRSDRGGQGLTSSRPREARKFFDEQGISSAPLDDPRHELGARLLPERRARDALRGSLSELTQHELGRVLPGPRQQLAYLGAREPDHEERALRREPKGVGDQLEDRVVGPVQILQDEHERALLAFCGEPLTQ